MNNLRPKITLGYSTLASRVGNILLPDFEPDVEILVLIQNPDGILDVPVPQRPDVRVVNVPSYGVAKSRNVAIREARGEYLVFADDDIRFISEGLRSVIHHLESHTCDLVLGQAVGDDGQLRKKYPNRTESLNLFNSARAATYEMVVRVDAVQSRKVTFDENFGAGVTNYLGDEYIFIVDLLRAGSSADFLPITLAQHPTHSSGSGWGSKRDLRARARVFTRVFGPLAPVIRAGFVARHLSEVRNPWAVFQFVVGKYSNKDG